MQGFWYGTKLVSSHSRYFGALGKSLRVSEFELIGVLRHMHRYFSHICDGIDVQADWRRSCTYGRAPNAIDISQGSLTCPSYTDTGPPSLYGDSDTPPKLIRLLDTVHLIFRGGGSLGFWSGPRYFQTKSEQDYFFRRSFRPDFFFHNKKLHL